LFHKTQNAKKALMVLKINKPTFKINIYFFIFKILCHINLSMLAATVHH